MTELSLTLPIINKPDKTEDPKINTALTAIQTWANGNVDSSNFPKALSTTTISAYIARAEVNFNETHVQPSLSRPCFANIDFEINPAGGFGAIVEIKVAGAMITEAFFPETQKLARVPISFLLAPGESWEAHRNETARASSLHVSYRVL